MFTRVGQKENGASGTEGIMEFKANSNPNSTISKLNLLGANVRLDGTVLTHVKGVNGQVIIPGVPVIGSDAVWEHNISKIVLMEGIETIKKRAIIVTFADSVERNVRLPESLVKVEKSGLNFGIDNLYIGAKLKKLCLDELQVDKGFEVSEENKYYSSYDGCLYSKNYKELLYIPYKKMKIKVHPDCQDLGNEDVIGWKKRECIDLSEIKPITVYTRLFRFFTDKLILNAAEIKNDAFNGCCIRQIKVCNTDEISVDSRAFNDMDAEEVSLTNYRIYKDWGLPDKPVIAETDHFDNINFKQLRALSGRYSNEEMVKRNLMEAIYKMASKPERNVIGYCEVPEGYEISNTILSRAADRFNTQCGEKLFYKLFEAFRYALGREEEVYNGKREKGTQYFTDQELTNQGVSYGEEYCNKFIAIYNQKFDDYIIMVMKKLYSYTASNEQIQLYKKTLEAVINEYVDSSEFQAAVGNIGGFGIRSGDKRFMQQQQQQYYVKLMETYFD